MVEHEPKDPQVTEELTAYLDGELEGDAVRRVEERLVSDATYRVELQRLERAWDLLDRLPRAAVSDAFTKSTIEMVAVVASQDAAEVRQVWPNRRWQQLLSVGAAAVAGLVGFAIGHFLWPNPDDALIRDLPVVENFEMFYQADDIDFIRLMDSEGLFADAETDHAR